MARSAIKRRNFCVIFRREFCTDFFAIPSQTADVVRFQLQTVTAFFNTGPYDVCIALFKFFFLTRPDRNRWDSLFKFVFSHLP